MLTKKILIVDDASADLLNLKNVVAKTNLTVFTATSGQQAIDIAKAEKPDLIFMDIVMEDIDGYHACREIHRNSETENIPIVFISSKNQKVDQMWAVKQGGKALIAKPYTEEQILEQIDLYC